MVDIEALRQAAPQKLDELAALHWFLLAEGIACDGFVVGQGGLAEEERPDFRLKMGDRMIGVEITMAQRPIVDVKFRPQQIEAAQNAFAEALEAALNPALPVIITLVFNDEVAVKPKEAEAALETIVREIDALTRDMAPRSGAMLVPTEGDTLRYPGAHVCAAIPDFLQSIQLYNDGQDFTAFTGSRGGIVPRFADADLQAILPQKHAALKGYRACDEHWLVIVSGMVPRLLLPIERPKLSVLSAATVFGEIDIARPVRSDFDRVYFFKSPSHAILLTDDT
jgi:hypothetical protein